MSSWLALKTTAPFSFCAPPCLCQHTLFGHAALPCPSASACACRVLPAPACVWQLRVPDPAAARLSQQLPAEPPPGSRHPPAGPARHCPASPVASPAPASPPSSPPRSPAAPARPPSLRPDAPISSRLPRLPHPTRLSGYHLHPDHPAPCAPLAPTANMVLPQLSSFFANKAPVNAPAPQQVGLDSITLGQLKAMVGSAPKPKVRPPLPAPSLAPL